MKEGDYEYFETNSSFPTANWPLIWIPTAKVTHATDPSQLRWWVARIDQILEKWRGYKGVVHVTSYAYRDFILEHTRHRERFITHTRQDARSKVDEFKRSTGDHVLLSPSVMAGHDFKDELCRFQVITKVPFPDTTDPLMAARCKEDKDYGMMIAAQKLMQMTGRGMRSETDWCTNFIIDDSISWFLRQYRGFVASWWLQGYRREEAVMGPLGR